MKFLLLSLLLSTSTGVMALDLKCSDISGLVTGNSKMVSSGSSMDLEIVETTEIHDDLNTSIYDVTGFFDLDKLVLVESDGCFLYFYKSSNEERSSALKALSYSETEISLGTDDDAYQSEAAKLIKL